MKQISKTFLTGLVTLLPLVATLYLFWWLIVSMETLLGRGIKLIMPEAYLPGMGVALGIVVVFCVGMAMRTWFVQRLFTWAESLLFHLPLVKSIYGALRDFFGLFGDRDKKRYQQVVLVTLGETQLTFVGFVTRDDLSTFPAPMNDAERISVYLPFSYQIGGYTALVPRHLVQPLDMSFEEAMKFVLTAAVSKSAVERKPN